MRGHRKFSAQASLVRSGQMPLINWTIRYLATYLNSGKCTSLGGQVYGIVAQEPKVSTAELPHLYLLSFQGEGAHGCMHAGAQDACLVRLASSSVLQVLCVAAQCGCTC